jgi:hypothetical protein
VKKILLIVTLLMLVTASFGFASEGLGLGVEGVFGLIGPSPTGGFALTGSPPKVPLVIGLNFAFGQSIFQIGGTFDWWLIQETLAAPLGIYAGPGAFFYVNGMGGGAANFGLGIRVPVGLQVFIFDFWELFLELAPGVAFQVTPVFTPNFALQLALGTRFWF